MVTAVMAPSSPGVYDDVPYEVYAKINAVRRSKLTKAKTMAHFRQAELSEDDSSDATEFGTALHAATLEPERFDRDVVIGPINPSTGEPYGRDTKKCKEWADLPENKGKIIVAKDYRERLQGMAKALRDHPAASALLAAVTKRELTIVWDDEETGVRCKVRLDAHIPSSLHMDLKSTDDASPEAFSKSIFNFGYDIQTAMSIDGWRSVMGEDLPFIMLAVEKDPPYAVAVYELGEESISIARRRYRDILRSIAEARKSGRYPAYSDGALPIEVPAWARKKFE